MSQGLALKYLSVVVAAIFKFLAGPLAGLALGLEWYETALCSALGMMIGVVMTTYIGKGIQLLLAKRQKKPPRRFTRASRMTVQVWKRFGIIGIAALTPLLLSPMGGAAISVAFRVHRYRIFLWMLISSLTVGALICYLVFSLKFVQKWFLG